MKSTGMSMGVAFLGFVLAAMCLTSACDDSTTTDPTPVIALYDVTVEPDPVSAVASTNEDFQWLASFTVTFTETAGVGADIQSIDVKVTETTDGVAVQSDEEVKFEFQIDNESTRIEGNSSKDLSFSVFYTLPGGGTEATIDIDIPIRDDNDAEVGGVLQVRVE